jgi:hypothetical protein
MQSFSSSNSTHYYQVCHSTDFSAGFNLKFASFIFLSNNCYHDQKTNPRLASFSPRFLIWWSFYCVFLQRPILSATPASSSSVSDLSAASCSRGIFSEKRNKKDNGKKLQGMMMSTCFLMWKRSDLLVANLSLRSGSALRMVQDCVWVCWPQRSMYIARISAMLSYAIFETLHHDKEQSVNILKH